MTQLFLDTSNHKLIIALYKNNEKIYELIEESDNKISNTLLVKIKTVLDKLNIKINEIKKIYVVNGPGSFTGTRIGLTFAKILAYSLNISVTPISELELLTSGSDEEYTLSLIDARRGYVYAGLYDKNLNCVLDDQYIYLNDLMKTINEKYQDIKIVSYDKFEDIKTFEPTLNISNTIYKHDNDIGVNPHILNPNYLKKTEAEEKLNDTCC